MNKKLLLCLTCLLALSCAKNDSDEHARLWTGGSFFAQMHPLNRSKTSLTDYTKVSWNESDAIAVCPDASSPVQFSATSSGAQVEFTSSAGEVSGSSFIMVYPYDAFQSVNSGNLLVRIPERQTAVASGFDPSAAVSVACSQNLSDPVTFHNAHALLKLNLPEDFSGSAVRVEVESRAGEALAGELLVDPSSLLSEAGSQISSKVVLESSPAMVKDAYYLAVMPVMASAGIRVKVSMDDRSCYLRESGPLKFESNWIYSLGQAGTKGWSYGEPRYDVTTVVGSPSGTAESEAGAGTSARLSHPQDIIRDENGDYWITTRRADTPAIWKMTPDHVISKVADVPAGTYPWGGCRHQGNFYFAAKGTSSIYKCADDGTLTTVSFTWQDGTDVTYANAMKVDFDAEGFMYVLYRHADVGKNYLLKIDPALSKVVKEWSVLESTYDAFAFDRTRTRLFLFGYDDIRVVDTSSDEPPVRIAGGSRHTSPSEYTDGTPGQPLTATVAANEGVVCDDDGVFYFGDIKAFTLRAFRPDINGDYSKGTIETLCGSIYTAGSEDGTGDAAVLKYPGGIAACADGVYMVDGTASGTIRKITFGYDTYPCEESADREGYEGIDDVVTIF